MKEKVIQINGMTINSKWVGKTSYLEKNIVFEILLHVVGKPQNIYEVLLTIQW